MLNCINHGNIYFRFQKDALDRLIVKVHAMHADMHEAALASVHLNRESSVAKARFSKTASKTGTSAGQAGRSGADSQDRENRPASISAILPALPKLAGKSKVFVPLPLLEPPKLQTAKLVSCVGCACQNGLQ